MIITPHADPVTHNLGKAKIATFGMAKNPQKMIQVLVRSLYSNPTLATLVELGQNSHDEHKRCGKENIPFEVTLPTLFEPVLRVRDFGRGISHDYMMDGYLQVFQSTKDNDDEMSGGYGIGRCVVLSLSSTYTVVTFIQGKKRTYSVYESDKGIELVYLSIENTDEPDGTLITAPVAQSEIDAFRRAAHRAYRYYKTQPIIKGVPADFVLEKPTYVIEGSNWAIEEGNSTPKAICGIYQYDIIAENMGTLSKTHNELIMGGGLVLRFGPSDLQVQANRQGLHYDERTREMIVKAMKVVENEAATLLNKNFDACASYYDAKVKWGEYYGKDTMYKIGRITKSLAKLNWKGIPLEGDTIEFKNIADIEAVGYIWKYNSRIGDNRIVHETGYVFFPCSSSHHIFINDMPGGKGGIHRVKSYLREIAESGKGEQRATTIYFKTEEAKTKFFATTHMQMSDFKLVSSLPKPTATRGENANYSRAKMKYFIYDGENCDRYDKPSDSWSIDVDFDLNTEKGVYVIIDRYRAFYNGSEYAPYALRGLLSHVKAIGGFANDETLIGIREKAIEEQAIVKNNPNWISLSDYIQQLVKNYKIDQADLDILAEQRDLGNAIPSILSNCDSEYYKFDSTFPDLQKIINEVRRFKKSVKRCDDIEKKYASFKHLGGTISIATVASKCSARKDYAILCQRFPILNLFTSAWDMRNNIKIIDQTLHQLAKLEEMEKAEKIEEVA